MITRLLGTYKVQTLLFLMLALLLFSPYAIPSVHAATQSSQAATNSPSPVGRVNVTTYVPSTYEFFSLNVPEIVNSNLSLVSLNLSAPLSITIVSSFRPSTVKVYGGFTNGTVLPLPFTPTSGISAAFYGIHMILPQNTVNMSASIQGVQSGESLLWRDITNNPFVGLQSSLQNVAMFRFSYLVTDSNAVISQAYLQDGRQAQIPSNRGGHGGNTTFVVSAAISAMVIQSRWYFPASILITVVAAVVLILTSFGIFLGRKSPLKSLAVRAPKMRLPRLPQWLKKFDAKHLLVLFILCGMIMVSLAVATGPDPHFKAYVIADPNVAREVQVSLSAVVPDVQVITPAQDYSDFQVMSSVGMIDLVVVSSYSLLNLGTVSRFVIGSLSNVPIIMIDNSSNPSIASQIRALYPGQVLNVTNAMSLTPAEVQSLKIRIHNAASGNILNLQLGTTTFKGILIAESVLSFVLVFLGWAYIGSKFSEPSTEQSLARLALIVSLGVFVFYYSEVIYVATSSILRMPLSLHAVISGAKDVTAVGVLGFGGGSTPRLLAAAGGLLLGAMSTGWESRYGRKSLLILISLILILVANPFAPGQYVYQGLALLVGNVNLGAAYSSILTLKGFIYGIGTGIGGNASPVYLLSAGKMLFFAGLIPFAFLNRMGKTTASLALLLVLPLLAHGGVRVGEMTPDKTVIAVLPGIMGGFVIAFILLLIAALERYIARNYVRT